MRYPVLLLALAANLYSGTIMHSVAQTPPVLPPDIGTIPEKIQPSPSLPPTSPGPTDPQLPPKGPDGIIRPPSNIDSQIQKRAPSTGDNDIVVPPTAPLDDKPASPNR